MSKEQQQYTDEELLDYIRELAENGERPTVERVNEEIPPCYSTYYYRFGNLSNAVEQAGVEPDDRTHYTDDECLDWIHTFVGEYGVAPSNKDLRDWPGPCAATYANRFGSFHTAIREAGYEPRGEPNE